jgi:oleandomycin transport system ATP-binding protein
VIAEGTSDELKAQVGGLVLEVHPAIVDCDKAARVLREFAEPASSLRQEEDFVSASVAHPSVLGPVVLALEKAGVTVEDLALRRASLDEVFLTLTGRPAESIDVEEEPAREGSLA